MKLVNILLSAFIAFATVACSQDNRIDKMEQIKSVGNENPRLALEMLDSLELDVRNGGEYLRNKYDILKIRLSDKADILPISDMMIKKLVAYFEKEGTAEEKQEVYYYAGSVYRDLQDTPRALDNFFKSLDAAEGNNDCDSIMLRNTYSNLTYLQAKVHNYQDAAFWAKKEIRISEKLGIEDAVAYMQLAAAYHAMDSTKMAVTSYDEAYRLIAKNKDKSEYQEPLIRLLCDYSEMHELEKAKRCIAFIEKKQDEYLTSLRNQAFARYYDECGKNDSAVIYCKRIIDDGKHNMYNAAKQLYHLYDEMGDINQAYRYANIYMQLSDSLDFGKRQELAATVNNAYKYHLDEKRERALMEERERYRVILLTVLFATIAIVAILCLLHTKRRNIQLRRIVELSAEQERLKDSDKLLRMAAESKEAELRESREQLERSNGELEYVKKECERVSTELAERTDALRVKEKQLSEKMEQNKVFIRLLHKSEMEEKVEDVIRAVKQSASGKRSMSSAEWKQLYHAVDDLNPAFKERLLKEFGSFTEQQQQVCYLMRIGMTKLQIQNLTGLSRVTVWRWVKKYEWATEQDSNKEQP